MTPDSSLPLYVGLDGGGSTLRALLADATLKPIRQTHDPRSVNLATLGQDEVRARLLAALDELLHGQDVAQVRACCIGLAGAEQYLGWLRDTLAERLPGVAVVAVNDGEIAWWVRTDDAKARWCWLVRAASSMASRPRATRISWEGGATYWTMKAAASGWASRPYSI